VGEKIREKLLKIFKGVDVGKETKSRTEKDSFIEERIFGDHHYKNTISNGKDKVEGRGRTSKEAEKTASEKWDKKHS
jgi:hypothetical protein